MVVDVSLRLIDAHMEDEVDEDQNAVVNHWFFRQKMAELPGQRF